MVVVCVVFVIVVVVVVVQVKEKNGKEERVREGGRECLRVTQLQAAPVHSHPPLNQGALPTHKILLCN